MAQSIGAGTRHDSLSCNRMSATREDLDALVRELAEAHTEATLRIRKCVELRREIDRIKKLLGPRH